MPNKNESSPTVKIEQLSDGKSSQNIQRPVIPVGARFQADLPTFTGPIDQQTDSSCWLGTKVWPLERTVRPVVERLNVKEAHANNSNSIGRGRSDVCACRVPGSYECIKRHVTEEKNKLQVELGPAFGEWKFGDMGEGASWNWTAQEKQKFESIVEKDSMKDDGFLRSSLKALPKKKRENIVSYYFNIIVPRQISMKIKSGLLPTEINTDDEATEATSSRASRPKKRYKTKSESANRRYLTGVR